MERWNNSCRLGNQEVHHREIWSSPLFQKQNCPLSCSASQLRFGPIRVKAPCRRRKLLGGPRKLNCAPKCESDICSVCTLGLYVYILKLAKMQLFQAELHTARCAVSDLAVAGRASGKPQKVAKECLQGCFFFPRRPSASIRVAWLSIQNGWGLRV